LAVVPLAAQVFVPARSATADAGGGTSFPGFGTDSREQVLIAPGLLGGLAGKQIVGLTVRRDTAWTKAMAGGAVDLEIEVSTSRADPANPSPIFARNAGATVRVFQGRVNVPNSPAVGTPHDPWAAANTVQIVFSTPFPYASDTLCIDIVGRVVAGQTVKFWRVDADFVAATGGALPLGPSCVRTTNPAVVTALTADEELRLGGSAKLIAFGQPQTPAILMVGTRISPTGIDLGPLGAPGCWLHVQAMFSSWMTYSAPPVPGVNGHARSTFVIPGVPALAGGKLYVQWANLDAGANAAGITFSNGLELTASAMPSPLGLATVRAQLPAQGLPASGVVDVHLAPVLRFQVQ
jgi:hypothetical protein